jgi:hypothetical protein
MAFLLSSVLIPLLKSYLINLATKEVADRVLFEVADAAVKSTKTDVDDKIYAFIDAAVHGRPLPEIV